MRFLVDAQLPPALARWIEDQGYRAEHVADVELLRAPDLDIWACARDKGAVLVTKDEDFAVWRNTASGRDPVIIWVRTGNRRKSALLSWMATAWPRVIDAIEQGEYLIELK